MNGGVPPVAYMAFEGEQHGFRKAATIIAVAAAELAFYGRVLGFAPATDGTGEDDNPLEIANEEAIRRPVDQPSSLMACLGQSLHGHLHLGAQLLGRVLVEHVQEVVVAHLEHLGRGRHAQGVALTLVEVDDDSHVHLRSGTQAVTIAFASPTVTP